MRFSIQMMVVVMVMALALGCVAPAGSTGEPMAEESGDTMIEQCAYAAAVLAACAADPTGEDCTEGSEPARRLASPACNTLDAKADGRIRRALAGEGCTVDAECAEDLRCIPLAEAPSVHVCDTPVSDGGLCDTSADCAGGMLCRLVDGVDGTSVLACGQCGHDDECGDGFVCRSVHGWNGCHRLAEEGERCSAPDDCADGLLCEDAVCRIDGPAPCSSDTQCTRGTTCRFVSPGVRTCAPPSLRGGYCDDEADCDPTMVCRWDDDHLDRRCQPPAAWGTFCDEDADCRRGYFCGYRDVCSAPSFGGGGGGGGCFAPGTRVSTPDGEVAIDELEVGDEVVAYDEATGEVGVGVVSRLHTHDDQRIGRVVLANGTTVRATPNHPFFRAVVAPAATDMSVEGGESRVEVAEASALRAGDVVLVRVDGELLPTRVRRWESDGSTLTVHNITVLPQHTYFAEGVLVHNK